MQSLSRLFALVREADFPVPFQPSTSHNAVAQPVLHSDSVTGSELMTLSESVLASFAPHLQLMLNPQAKVLSGESPDGADEGKSLPPAQEVVGDEAVVAELATAPAPDVCRSDE